MIWLCATLVAMYVDAVHISYYHFSSISIVNLFFIELQ